MSDWEYIYRFMTLDDVDQVRQLCYQYWRFETISRALGLEVPRECERHVEYMLTESFINKSSLIAEEKSTGKIVGMNICVIATPDNPQDWTFPKDDPDCEKMIKIEEICDKLNITSDYFKFYNVDKIEFCIGTVVVGSHQRKGVALKLCQKGMEIERRRGIRLFITDCTSDYSRKIADKLGFTKMKQALLVDPESGIPLRLPGEDRDLYGSLHVLRL